jgi:hypothetical protein
MGADPLGRGTYLNRSRSRPLQLLLGRERLLRVRVRRRGRRRILNVKTVGARVTLVHLMLLARALVPFA